MVQPFYVLQVGHDSAEAPWLPPALVRIGFAPMVEPVETAEALASAVADRAWCAAVVHAGGVRGLSPAEAVGRLRAADPALPVFAVDASPRDVRALLAAGVSDFFAAGEGERFAIAAARARGARPGRDGEAVFLELARRMPIGLFRTSPEGRLLYGNPALARILGRERIEDVLSTDVSGLGYPIKDSRRHVSTGDRLAIFETSWTRDDGMTLVTREASWGVYDEAGALRYYEGTFEDVTAERLALAREQRRARQMEAIVRLAQTLDGVEDAQSIARATVVTARELLGVRGAMLLLPDASGLEPAAWTDDLDAQAVRTLTAFAMGQGGGGREASPALNRLGIGSYIRRPIRYGDRLVAMLLLVEAVGTVSDIVEESVVAAMGWHVAAALARHAAERAASDSASTLHSIAKATGHVLHRRFFDDTEEEYVSDSIEAVTGFTAAEVRACGGLRALVTETRVLEGDLGFEGDTPYVALHRVRTRCGRLRWLQDRAYPRFGPDGRVVGLSGVMEDVTEREHAKADQARERAALQARQAALLDLTTSVRAPDVMLRHAAEAAAVATGTERVSVWLFEGDYAHCSALYRLDRREEGYVASVLRAELAFAEAVIHSERTLAIGDLTVVEVDSVSAEAYYARHDVQAILVAPIPGTESVTGYVRLEHCGSPRQWTEAESDFTASVATLLALSLERAERQRAEAALRDSEQRYRAVADLASDYAYEAHHSESGSHIAWVTNSFERLTGYDLRTFGSPREASATIIHPEDRAAVLDTSRRLHKGEIVEFDTRILTREGEVRWLRHRAAPVLDTQGRVAKTYAMGRDVTERMETKERLHQALAAAERALDEAESARARAEAFTRLKSSFVANMSHEIRTPLTGIIGFAEVLADEVPEVHREFASLIAQGSRRLLETLNSVLDLARLEDGKATFNVTSFDAATEVRQVCSLLTLQAEEKGLALVVRSPEAVPVMLDRGALVRIVTNLVGNAIKFTDTGRVEVVLSTADELTLRVEDTGVGMNEAFLPSLFEEFEQEARPSTSERIGSGLGLSITRRLVELLGGTIAVESHLGEGTTFTVRLPLTLSESMPSRDSDAMTTASPRRSPLARLFEPEPLAEAFVSLDDLLEEPEAEHDPLIRLMRDGDGWDGLPPDLPHQEERQRVLLVEDNAETRLLIARMLEDHVEVVAVPDARAALERMAHEAFAVLLLDIHLGGRQTGSDVLRVARTLPGYEMVPAIAVTAFAMPDDRRRLLGDGFNEYVVKPFTRDGLLRALRRVGLASGVV